MITHATQKIPSGWKETTLGEVAVLNYGEGLKFENRTHGPIPVYGSSGVTGFHDEALVKEPGYIVGRKGTVGSIYYSPIPFFPIDTVYYTTKKDIKCDFDFFYYLLQTLNLEKLNFDSAVPGLSRSMAYSLQIKIPVSEFEQQAIAAVLSSLDNKIEFLREQNKILETTAQSIFKEWFIKSSLNKKLPKGWTMGGLSEIANFLNGIALQKYPAAKGKDSLPAIKIRELNAGITDVTDRVSRNVPEQYIIHDGDILFSWSGSLEVVIWQHGDGALNQHLFKVTSEKYPKWFYYFWLLRHLSRFRAIAANKATTMGHIQRYHLDKADVVIPDDATIKELNALMGPIFNKIILNNSQIEGLIKLRGVILPKLLRGKVRVKEFSQ